MSYMLYIHIPRNDGYIHNLNHDLFWKVLAPKAFGAWLLHDDTVKHNDPIDFFVMMSSLNVVVGLLADNIIVFCHNVVCW